MIRAALTRIRCRDDVQTRAANFKEYPELLLNTDCHCLRYLVFQETPTARLRLLWQGKRTTKHKDARGAMYAQWCHWNFQCVRVITWPPPHSTLDPRLKTCIHYHLKEHLTLSCRTIILCEQMNWRGILLLRLLSKLTTRIKLHLNEQLDGDAERIHMG